MFYPFLLALESCNISLPRNYKCWQIDLWQTGTDFFSNTHFLVIAKAKYSFVYSFNKHLLSTYWVPVIVLVEDAMMNNRHVPTLVELGISYIWTEITRRGGSNWEMGMNIRRRQEHFRESKQYKQKSYGPSSRKQLIRCSNLYSYSKYKGNIYIYCSI